MSGRAIRRSILIIALMMLGTAFHGPTEAAEIRATDVVDRSTLDGKVMVGYQGWFACDGDETRLGWVHWAKDRNRMLGPGNVSVDLWPDVSELAPEERYATGFKLADGSPAEVFSSNNRSTVMRHVKWMRDYGIDGAFVQRFANELSMAPAKAHRNAVLSHIRDGCQKYGRSFAVMYDLSGLRRGEVDRVRQDWLELNRNHKLNGDATYQQHAGKPLVAIWGIGFNDGRDYTLEECAKLVQWFSDQGCAVMLGVPSFWREGTRDAVDDPRVHELLQAADIVSPWTIGRYRTSQEAERHAENVWKPDLQWCQGHGVEYLPVIFPGFSWHHLHGGKLNEIPRERGEFLWSQATAAKRAGCRMVYIAMFDEVDEGTAIFKCTNDPPTGEGVQFATYEGLPSDHYLKVAGAIGEMLRGKLDASTLPPVIASPRSPRK